MPLFRPDSGQNRQFPVSNPVKVPLLRQNANGPVIVGRATG
jgi:hypothetical protein